MPRSSALGQHYITSGIIFQCWSKLAVDNVQIHHCVERNAFAWWIAERRTGRSLALQRPLSEGHWTAFDVRWRQHHSVDGTHHTLRNARWWLRLDRNLDRNGWCAWQIENDVLRPNDVFLKAFMFCPCSLVLFGHTDCTRRHRSRIRILRIFFILKI